MVTSWCHMEQHYLQYLIRCSSGCLSRVKNITINVESESYRTVEKLIIWLLESDLIICNPNNIYLNSWKNVFYIKEFGYQVTSYGNSVCKVPKWWLSLAQFRECLGILFFSYICVTRVSQSSLISSLTTHKSHFMGDAIYITVLWKTP